MNEPTQEDFEAWKATVVDKRFAKWDGPELAWTYLCELCTETPAARDACYRCRCCANQTRCKDAETIMKCRNRQPPDIKIIIERIDTLVQEFVRNGNSFPKRKKPNDRVRMVLEDLLSTTDGESP